MTASPEQFLREFLQGWIVLSDHESREKHIKGYAKLLKFREQEALETFIFKQLNERQVAIYKYAQANGGVIECSLRELGSHVGMRNPQLVKHHLVALVDMGLLESTSGVQLNKGATRTYRIAQLTTPNNTTNTLEEG